MKRTHKIALASLLVVGAIGLGGAAAYGHEAGGGNCHAWGGHYRRHGDPRAFLQYRLTAIKDELKITPSQEKDWQAFADKATQVGDRMIAAGKQMREKPAQTVPQRLDQRTQFMKQRLADMEEISAAAKKLYATLTPEQKAVADKVMDRAHRHGPRFDRG